MSEIKAYLEATLANLKQDVAKNQRELAKLISERANISTRIAELQKDSTKKTATILELTTVISQYPTDHRPTGWEEGYAFSIPSKSGGAPHEIVGAYRGHREQSGLHTVADDYDWSCNCIAGKFGRICWALTAAKRHVSNFTPLPIGGKRLWSTSRFTGKVGIPAGFGKIRA